MATPDRGRRPQAPSGSPRVMNLVLEDEDVLELLRILLDEDEQSALAWLRRHLGGKARHALEDRGRPDGAER